MKCVSYTRPPKRWRKITADWEPTGQSLRSLRRYLRLTQAELAAAWGLKTSTINHYEGRRNAPVGGKVRPLVVATCQKLAEQAWGALEPRGSALIRDSDLDTVAIADALTD